MMMRQIVASLIVALACVAFAPGSLASGASQRAQLSELISQNEDVQMTAEDLAFFLAIHNYDATPKEGFVQVKMDGTIWNLVPNAAAHGLADLTIEN
jgi:hypothetical protein